MRVRLVSVVDEATVVVAIAVCHTAADGVTDVCDVDVESLSALCSERTVDTESALDEAVELTLIDARTPFVSTVSVRSITIGSPELSSCISSTVSPLMTDCIVTEALDDCLEAVLLFPVTIVLPPELLVTDTLFVTVACTIVVLQSTQIASSMARNAVVMNMCSDDNYC